MTYTNPCQDCTNRHIGCHGECSAYKEWRAVQNKLNEKIRNDKHQKFIGYLGVHYKKLRR